MDEQQKYQYDYQSPPQRPVKKPQRRFLRIWGPLLLKFLIVYVISVIFSAVLMGNYFASTIGLDSQAIAEYMAVEENFNTVYNVIMEESIQYTTILEGIAALITIPIMLFMFHKDRVKEKVEGIIPAKKAQLWKYIAIILMSAALCVGINNLFFISNLASLSSSYEETMAALYNPSLGIQIICLGIIVPICEELVFRGLMYKRLREYSGFVAAMLYSALIFSFVHINLVQTIYAFVMGVVFAFVYEKYGSVKAPIAAHMTANILAVLATQYNIFDWVMQDQMRAGSITVACAAIAASMYVFIQRMDDEETAEGTEA